MTSPISASESPTWARVGDATWSRYRHNAARHLMGIARDLEQRSLHHLIHDRGYEGLRPSFGPLLSLVVRKETTVGELALALATSPQACSQLVDHCEAVGFVARKSAPEDGRRKIVCLTSDGERLVQDGVAILARLEDEYRAHLGSMTFERFAEALPRALRALGEVGEGAERGPVRIGPSLGVLPELSLQVQRTLMEATSARGHAGLKLSHAQVLPLIGPGGARVAALARVQGLSRQAISATAGDLVRAGYLRRERDLVDGRGVVFLLTRRGEGLLRDSVSSLDELDAGLRDALGVRRLRWLYDGAAELYGALRLEDDVFRGVSGVAGGAAASMPGTDLDDLRRLAGQLVDTLSPDGAKQLARMITEQVEGTKGSSRG